MMDCLNSMAPNDEELLRYALDDDPLSETTREHIKHCSICQRRLTRYRQANTLLLSKLYRSQCPSAMKLSYYCSHMLPTDEVMDITNHLQVCPLCTAEVADMRLALATFDPLEMPTSAFSPCSIIRRIIASLVPLQPQPVTRSGGVSETGWPRQYCAESLNVSLHLSRASNGDIMLLGLFTSADPDASVDIFENTVVELYRAPGPPSGDQLQSNGHVEEPLIFSRIDDLGNIIFKVVPVGEYVMIVHLRDSELVFEGLIIKHS